MIIVALTSGLGNQMFQYAFYRLMQERYPHTQVRADLTWFNMYREHNGFELQKIFGRQDNPAFCLQRATPAQLARVTGRIPPLATGAMGPVFDKLRYYPNRVIRLFTEKKKKPYMINQLEANGSEIARTEMLRAGADWAEQEDNRGLYERLTHLDTARDWYLSGFWIEEVYYRDRLDTLKQELKFDTEHMSPENREWAKRIASCESVGIHVRRGDYTGKYAGQFCVLGEDYYREAVLRIRELAGGDLTFFVFSDDAGFVEKEFGWLSHKEIVSGNRGGGSYRDMQLMSLCGHNIIANSTFSVWAALLNQNPGHLTLYPRQYMPGKDSEKKTIPGWHRIG